MAKESDQKQTSLTMPEISIDYKEFEENYSRELLLMDCLIITDKMLENNNGNNKVDEKVQYELLKCISLATEKIHKVANQLRNE